MVEAYLLPRTDFAQLQEYEIGDMVEVSETTFKDIGLERVDITPEGDTDDGEYEYERFGVIVDIPEDTFSMPSEDGEESVEYEVPENETIYLVSLARAGAYPFREDDILRTIDEGTVLGDAAVDDMDAVGESMEENAVQGSSRDDSVAQLQEEFDSPDDVPVLTSRTQRGLPPWPESWRESDKPARLIAMDAWTSMGMTFRGCRRSLLGHVRNPNRICAAFKDEIYGHPYWREGG